MRGIAAGAGVSFEQGFVWSNARTESSSSRSGRGSRSRRPGVRRLYRSRRQARRTRINIDPGHNLDLKYRSKEFPSSCDSVTRTARHLTFILPRPGHSRRFVPMPAGSVQPPTVWNVTGFRRPACPSRYSPAKMLTGTLSRLRLANCTPKSVRIHYRSHATSGWSNDF